MGQQRGGQRIPGGDEMTTTLEAHARAMNLSERFPGWHVWADRPTATRAGHQWPKPEDDTFARTLMCDTWPELAEQLAEQASNDQVQGYAK